MKRINEMSEEKRRFPRVMAPVYYRSARLFSKKRQVSDISLGGARIYSDKHMKIGTVIEIDFFLPDGLSITATARVVWIKELPPGSSAVYDVGMEFTHLPPLVSEKLHSVLKEEAGEPPSG